jgi:hypothetical protein
LHILFSSQVLHYLHHDNLKSLKKKLVRPLFIVNCTRPHNSSAKLWMVEANSHSTLWGILPIVGQIVLKAIFLHKYKRRWSSWKSKHNVWHGFK